LYCDALAISAASLAHLGLRHRSLLASECPSHQAAVGREQKETDCPRQTDKADQ